MKKKQPKKFWEIILKIPLYIKNIKILHQIPCFCVLSANLGMQYLDSTSSFWSTLFIARCNVIRCSWFISLAVRILRATEHALFSVENFKILTFFQFVPVRQPSFNKKNYFEKFFFWKSSEQNINPGTCTKNKLSGYNFSKRGILATGK